MSICSVKLKDIEKIDFIITKGMTAKEVYQKYKPNYILNGALYDMGSKTNIVNCKDEGKNSGYLFSSEGIGITEKYSLCWSKQEVVSKDFIGGAPCLVKDFKQFIDWGNKYSSYIDGKHVRSAIGFNDTHLFLVATDNETTIKELSNVCINLGTKYAINLDGGGSCHLQQDDKVLKSSTRANCSWILVYTKEQKEGSENVDKVTVKCNNKEQEGFIKDGVTYTPVRFLSENLGANVAWDSKTKTVTVTSK